MKELIKYVDVLYFPFFKLYIYHYSFVFDVIWHFKTDTSGRILFLYGRKTLDVTLVSLFSVSDSALQVMLKSTCSPYCSDSFRFVYF